jgi:hypothetical protein
LSRPDGDASFVFVDLFNVRLFIQRLFVLQARQRENRPQHVHIPIDIACCLLPVDIGPYFAYNHRSPWGLPPRQEKRMATKKKAAKKKHLKKAKSLEHSMPLKKIFKD